MSEVTEQQVRESIARLQEAVREGEPKGSMIDAVSDFSHEGAHVALTVPFPAFLAGVAADRSPAVRGALRRWVFANGRFTDPDGRRFRITSHVHGELSDSAITALGEVAPSASDACVLVYEGGAAGWQVTHKKDPFSRW